LYKQLRVEPMTDITNHLQQLGFSEYETKAYVTLLQQHPLNGYGLARASGIPRANIYGVLQKLEERGAVIAINNDSGQCYSPIAPDDLIRRLSQRLDKALAAAQQALEEIAVPVTAHYVQNIQGYTSLLEHAADLITKAQDRLLIALWQPEAQTLRTQLEQAQARGVIIDTLCCQACPQICDGCQGMIYRYRVAPDQQAHALIVIQDDTEMVVGTTGQQAIAIRTRQPTLVQMTTRYIQHSVTLAAVLTDLDHQLENLLSKETRQLVQSIGQGSSWLEQLLQILKS
jgi:HTH-type transcriptional regulator, sugar sensing transcriptional regulator